MMKPLRHKTAVLVAIALFCAGSGFAQAPDTGRVEGRVVDPNGDPVPRATVRFLGSAFYVGELPSRADEEGRFVFPEVAAGRWHMRAERNGYVTTYYQAKFSGSRGALVQVRAGETLTGIECTLEEQGVISGIVTDQEGKPRVNARVAAFSVRAAQRAQLGPGLDLNNAVVGSPAMAGSDGSFRIPQLPSGSYYVGTLELAAPAQGGRVAVSTFYPSATEFSRATPVEVEAGGETRGIRLISLDAPAVTVSGTVDLPESVSQPIALRLQETQPGPTFGLTRTAVVVDGAFRMTGVRPGSYLLRGTIPGEGAENTLFASVPLTVGSSDVEGVSVRFQPGVAVRSRISIDDADDAGSDEARNAAVENAAEAPEMNVSLRSADTAITSYAQGSVGLNGEANHPAIAPGSYLYGVAEMPDRYYLKSVSLGDQDGVHEPLEIAGAGGNSLEVTVELGSDGATLEGHVTDINGAPAIGATVILWPKIPWSGLQQSLLTTQTDQYGRYRISSVRPEEYWVAAWEDPGAGPVMELGEFRTRFEGSAFEIALETNASASADLLMIPVSQVLSEAEAFEQEQ